MRVLVLTQVLPYPPDSGPKVKTWNVLKYLAQRHEVTLRAGGGIRVKILNALAQGCPSSRPVWAARESPLKRALTS